MNDPLKTFLKRAIDGGSTQAKLGSFRLHKYGNDLTDEERNELTIIAVFNPEAAKAVWGEHKKCDRPGCETRHERLWTVVQNRILSYIQDGDTPLEALSKEL